MNVGPVRTTRLQQSICSEIVPFVDSFKNLGMTIDSSLKYKEHIVVAKGRQKVEPTFKTQLTAGNKHR